MKLAQLVDQLDVNISEVERCEQLVRLMAMTTRELRWRKCMSKHFGDCVHHCKRLDDRCSISVARKGRDLRLRQVTECSEDTRRVVIVYQRFETLDSKLGSAN